MGHAGVRPAWIVPQPPNQETPDMRRFALHTLIALTLAVSLVPAATPAAAEAGTSSDNMTHIKNLAYDFKYGKTKSYGTDIEFATLGGRDYAFAGSYDNGLQIVDITDPKRAAIAAVYDCGILQGDVQIFKQGTKTYATYTSENTSSIKVQSRCVRELVPTATAANKRPAYGTYIVDVTDPLNPQSAGFISVPEGSHNGTVHPSGKYFYNSNSSLYTDTVLGHESRMPGIEYFDISDVANPKRLGKLQLPFVPASLGTESHDLTFNTSGSRAYSAALSQGVIINTEDPANPTIVKSFADPSINVWHQSDPVTLTAADGTKRDFLIIEDEYAGAAGGPHCPSGGVHVYETTGAMERNPVKVGYWNIDDMRVTSPTGRCTAHVFDIHEKEGIMTMAFYNGGVRVIDISGLTGIGLGESTTVTGTPMREIGHYYFDNSDTWSVKTPKIQGNGDFYMYGNDVARGLDVYKFSAKGKKSKAQGQWSSGPNAGPRQSMSSDYEPFCLLPK
jgi:hypothetical protein